MANDRNMCLVHGYHYGAECSGCIMDNAAKPPVIGAIEWTQDEHGADAWVGKLDVTIRLGPDLKTWSWSAKIPRARRRRRWTGHGLKTIEAAKAEVVELAPLLLALSR